MFSTTNKILTHQPITRKIIVCKTLNLILFFFYFFSLKNKKQKTKKKNSQLPAIAHPDIADTAPRWKPPRCHFPVGRGRAATPSYWGVAARPSGSHPQFRHRAVAVVASGWDDFLFKTKIVKGRVLIQCFAKFC